MEWVAGSDAELAGELGAELVLGWAAESAEVLVAESGEEWSSLWSSSLIWPLALPSWWQSS